MVELDRYQRHAVGMKIRHARARDRLELFRRERGEDGRVVTLDHKTFRALKRHALARNITATALARKLLDAATKPGMVAELLKDE